MKFCSCLTSLTLLISIAACETRIEIADDDGGGGGAGGDGGASSSSSSTTSSSSQSSTTTDVATSSVGSGDGGGLTTGPQPYVPPICYEICDGEPDCSAGDCLSECIADYDPACDAEFNAYYACAIEQMVCDFSPCSKLSAAVQVCKASG